MFNMCPIRMKNLRWCSTGTEVVQSVKLEKKCLVNVTCDTKGCLFDLSERDLLF